jgi:cytochrome c oxidase assembly protein subunit 15
MNIVIVQFLLGILTLLWMVPIWLGILHQSGAFVLLAAWVLSYFLISNVAENT